MGYIKQNFKDGETLKASQLNYLENGIISASKDFNFWEGKTAVCVGDSITAGSGTTQTYWSMLKEILSLSKMTGMGVGGSCVSAKSDYGNGNSPLINRYLSIPEADLITIFMGTNDWGHETPLGTIDDTTDISFYGALNVIIPGLIEKHPNSRIIWITPMHRYGFGTSKILGTKFTYDHVKNGRECTLKDYVDAIKEVCERYSIPVIDLFSISGLHPSISAHRSTYMPDGLHPNKAGHEKMAYLISKWLQIYSSNEIVSLDPVVGVDLNINNAILQVGSSITLSASILPITANNKNVNWTIVSGSNYCKISSKSGTSCEITGLADGDSIVSVKTEDGGYEAQCKITITSSAIKVTGVEITANTNNVSIDGNITLTANILPETATDKSVGWLIVSGTEYVSIEPNGLNCVVTGISEGTSTISVTTNDGNFTKEYDVNVLDANNISGITLQFGNPFGTVEQQTSNARVNSTTNPYLNTGDVVTLNDNVNYKWALKKVTSETGATADSTFNSGNYVPESAWSSNKSYTITSSGYYKFILLKANNDSFNWSTDSNILGDYFTIS